MPRAHGSATVCLETIGRRRAESEWERPRVAREPHLKRQGPTSRGNHESTGLIAPVFVKRRNGTRNNPKNDRSNALIMEEDVKSYLTDLDATYARERTNDLLRAERQLRLVREAEAARKPA